ncbi:MAG: flagellar biosynthetic protein FliO [Planctomycetota bacterium]|nr:flagellar biosynthetic protein FliO [Planctomycetota bacterium]
MLLKGNHRKFETSWIRTVLLLAILVIVATSVIDAQQFPIPDAEGSAQLSGTQLPDERFANGGVVPTGNAAGSGNLWKTIQAIGAIFVIAGIGIGGFFLLRKYAPGAIPGTDARMKVLMRMPIGNRQNITIVRIGERVLVVGASSGRLECLSEITDPQEVQNLSYGVEFSKEIDRMRIEGQEQQFPDTTTPRTAAQDTGNLNTTTHDVRHEIDWLRERLEGFGERVNGEVGK